MEKRKWENIKSTNVETSLLGFGCMRFKTIDGEIDEEKALALVDKAYKSGVNYFDTALPYTNRKNETFVGKALKRYPRESFYLASKFSIFCFETKEEALKSMDIQLNSLQTDYIDFYLVHALNKDSYKKFCDWGMMEVIEKWKKEGKIKHIGFSFHDSYEVFMDILNSYNWEFVQIQLNYMDVDSQQGLKGYYELEKRGIPVVIMEPIKGGKLAEFNEEVAKDFRDYSDDSLSRWALRWVGSLKGVKVILSGMNEMEQVEDNLETFEDFKPLNETEQEIVKGVREKLQSITRVGCTSCKYCMPCPQNVNIPAMFKIYNDYASYKNEKNSKWMYSGHKEKGTDATKCVECGLCIDKCPQGIKIPEEFKKMYKEMSFLK